MAMLILILAGVFFHRRGDPAAEQRRLLEERVRIERRLAQVESAERDKSVAVRAATASDQLLPSHTLNGVDRHVSWSDGYPVSRSLSPDIYEEGMPPRISFSRKRRNALGHKAHRKSLMQGILSVANGDGKTPTVELKEGKTLPGYLTNNNEPDNVYQKANDYRPLPDPDTFYENTFIVVNNDLTVFRFSEAKSLFLFGKDSRIRQAAINLFIRPIFSHFIMLVILANCFCMVLAVPPFWVEAYLEYVFTAIYCMEALIKIIARGFVLHRFSYLRDPWNWLDFIVIVFALITEVLKALVSEHVSQFSVLRAFRVLRALKTMSVVPGLRAIVKALLRSIRALKDAIVLTIFCVSVFALIGYQLFHGTLRNKCVLEPGNFDLAPDAMYVVDLLQRLPDGFKNESSESGNNADIRTFPAIGLYESCGSVSEDISSLEKFENLAESLTWNEYDEHLTASLVNALNETRFNVSKTDKLLKSRDTSHVDSTIQSTVVPPLLFSDEPFRSSTEPNLSKSNCPKLYNECIVKDSYDVTTSSTSSLLQLATIMTYGSKEDVFSRWDCYYDDDQTQTPTTREFGVSSSSFSYYSDSNIQYSETRPAKCSISVVAFSANISCMYSKLTLTEKVTFDNGTRNLTASDLPCQDNIWVRTMTYGETQVPFWETRKSIIFFTVQREEVKNASRVSKRDVKQRDVDASEDEGFFNDTMFLLFDQLSRKEMSKEEESDWNWEKAHYLMTDTDSGQYFYLNSSNRPPSEPQYCILGDNAMCPSGYKCQEAGGNPDFGYTNFDQFFWAFLTSFRLIAQDAWSRLYYLTLHTIGKTYVIYYIIIMFLGSYYLINLILAVVYMAYEEQQAVSDEEEIEAAERELEILEQTAIDAKEGAVAEEEILGSRTSLKSGPLESRHCDLITTSLTSITDSLPRSRYGGSRRSRYGQRRTPKPDPVSDHLYHKFTLRHGDGISNENLENLSCDLESEEGKCHPWRWRSRRSSYASDLSHTMSIRSVCTRCNSKDDLSHRLQFPSHGRRRCSRSMCEDSCSDLPMSTHAFNPVVSNTTESGPTEKDGQISIPVPIILKQKYSKLDVLPVEYSRGRSNSVCSSISESGTFSIAVPYYCQECRKKRKCRMSSSSSGQSTVLLDASSLRQKSESRDPNEDSTFLPIPIDRANRLSSSSSASFDAEEQVVQAEISHTSHWLTPPSGGSIASSKNAELGSCNALSTLSQRRDSTLPTYGMSLISSPPLQVPCLLITSASSEHISSLSKEASESSLVNTDKLLKEKSPDLVCNTLEWGVTHEEEIIPKKKLDVFLPGVSETGDSSCAAFKRRQWRDQINSFSNVENEEAPLCNIREVCGEDLGSPTTMFSSRSQSQNFSQYDAAAAFRAVAFNEDVESYEMPLMDGVQNGETQHDQELQVVTHHECSEKKSRPFKRMVQHNYNGFKRAVTNVFCKWSCCPSCWQPFQANMKIFVLDPFMDLFITLCILLNTLSMTIEQHPMEQWFQNMLEQANLAFTIIFALEMFLKIIGMGPHTYFKETWNLFDAVIVISSLLELLLQSIQGISVLRTFRLLRILKLAKSWPTLNKLLRIIGRTLGKLWHLTIVFLLVLFIFAVVGMQLLREKYVEEYHDNMPRWNFVDFQHSFMVVFRIQCGEWIENMFACMNIAHPGICIPLFVLVYIIGNLVILNLFLALLLNSFCGDALQRIDSERNSIAEAMVRIRRWSRKCRKFLRSCNLQLTLRKKTSCNEPKIKPIAMKKKMKNGNGSTDLPMDPASTGTTFLNEDVHSSNNTSKRDPDPDPDPVISCKAVDKQPGTHNENSTKPLNGDKPVTTTLPDLLDNNNHTVQKNDTENENDDHGHHQHHHQQQHHHHHHSHSHHRSNTRRRNSRCYIDHNSLRQGSDEKDSPCHKIHRPRNEEARHHKHHVVRCHGCNTQIMPRSPERRLPRRRIKEGFAPASEFQNDTFNENKVDPSNRDDEETSPMIQQEDTNIPASRSRFPAYDSIEYTRTPSCEREILGQKRSSKRNRKSKSVEESIDEVVGRSRNTKRDSWKQGQASSLPLSRKNSPIPAPAMLDVSTAAGKLLKYKGAEESDVPLRGSVHSSRPPSIKNGSTANGGILRRKSTASVSVRYHSGRASISSVKSNYSSIRSHKPLSNASSAAELGAAATEETETKEEIRECMPLCFNEPKDGDWWKIRKFFYDVVNHPYFENLVIFCILLSSIALAFEDIHLNSRPTMKRVLEVLDIIFCIFFTVEMLLKWIGHGLKYYFTNAWCLLDFVIVFVSLLNLSMSKSDLGSLRVLRTFRALRPLRALSRFQGMKVVVDALMRAIPSIAHVFLVCVIVWLIFSILGVNLFAGRFGRCVLLTGDTGIILPRPPDDANETFVSANINELCNPNITLPLRESEMPQIANKQNCTECGELMNTPNRTLIQWVIPSINFDNVFQGLLALMQVATFKGWLEIMNNAIDIRGIEVQPSYEYSFHNYLYFCIFIVFGAFFSLNLFIGVIIDNFNQQKVKCAGGEDGVFLTDEQRRYYNAMKKMAAKTPKKPIPRPTSRVANKIYDLVTSRKFEIIVMAMILLNMVVMALEHYDMSPRMDLILENFNFVFIGIFTVEAILKLIGLRQYYFTIPWNVFDIIVVVVSVIASAISDLIEQYFVQPTLFRIIRLFRVTRILRLIREAKGIRTLLFALMMSIPALFNIGSLLMLVIFIYAILGMSQFAYVQKIAGVNDLLNFETFPNSFLVLFQMSTSEGWNTFIEPILRDKPPFCDPTIANPTNNGNCGNSTVGVVYFVTFVLITFLIVINMYIAIILENFEVATRESSEPLTADDFEQFFEVWQRYDDRLTQFVTFDQLQHLLHHLDFPLQVRFPNAAFIANARMRITPDGNVHCLEVIIALIKRVLGDSPELNNFKEAMVQSFMLKCRSKESPNQEETIDTMEYVRRLKAVVVLQRAYRDYKCRLGDVCEESDNSLDSSNESFRTDSEAHPD